MAVVVVMVVARSSGSISGSDAVVEVIKSCRGERVAEACGFGETVLEVCFGGESSW